MSAPAVSVPSMSNIAPRSTREPLLDMAVAFTLVDDMALTLVDEGLLPHRAAVLNDAREAPAAETERMQLEEVRPSRWSAASGAPIQRELVRGDDHVASRGHTSPVICRHPKRTRATPNPDASPNVSRARSPPLTLSCLCRCANSSRRRASSKLALARGLTC